jgi:tight adherence protein C
MIDAHDLVCMFVFLLVFLGTVGGGALLLYHLYGDNRRALARLRDLSPATTADPENAGVSGMALSALPKLGALVLPGNTEQLAQLKARLTQAGIYGPSALSIFLGAQLILTLVLPLTAGLTPFLLGLLEWHHAVMIGCLAGGVGLFTPSFWVDYQRSRRQNELRRALPDALDMLVLCIEAGVSLPAAVQRVTTELQVVHTGLAREMNIVQREVQLGLSIGEAMKKFGDRCELEEVRNLAAVILQAERYGAGSVKALRQHAESCRVERQQCAEERAQKAAVKILFPTLLCIFPAIFIVILGPAAYQIAAAFSRMK